MDEREKAQQQFAAQKLEIDDKLATIIELVESLLPSKEFAITMVVIDTRSKDYQSPHIWGNSGSNGNWDTLAYAMACEPYMISDTNLPDRVQSLNTKLRGKLN